MNLSTKGPLGCYLLLFSSVLSLLLSCCCGCKKNEAHILRLTGKPQVFHEPTDRKFHPGSHIGGNTQSTGNSLPFQGMKDTLPYYNTKQHTTAKEIDTDKWPGKLKGKNHSFWFGGVQGEGAGRRCPALSWTLPNHWAPSAVCGLNLEPFTWSCLAFGITCYSECLQPPTARLSCSSRPCLWTSSEAGQIPSWASSWDRPVFLVSST